MVYREKGNVRSVRANEPATGNDDGEGSNSQVPESADKKEFRIIHEKDEHRLRSQDQRGSQGDGQKVRGADGYQEKQPEQEQQRAEQLHQRSQRAEKPEEQRRQQSLKFQQQQGRPATPADATAFGVSRSFRIQTVPRSVRQSEDGAHWKVEVKLKSYG